MAKKKNASIKCDVESCKHNDCSCGCGYCSLDEIKVSCTCNHDEAEHKDVTVCDSFECDCNKKEA